MKKIILVALLVALTAPCLLAQKKVVREFIREHRRGKENIAVTVPGFLIGLAGGIGKLASECEEEKIAFSLIQELGTTKVLTFDTDDFNTRQDVSDLLRTLEGEHGYERWATMRAQSGEQAELTVQVIGKTIREIAAIVTEPKEHRAVFLHARTHFTAEELGEVLMRLLVE